MTELAFLKPWLTALILPPGSPLLLMLLGYLLATRSERIGWMAIGKMLFVTAFVGLWLFCLQGTAIFLERVVLRPPSPLDPQLVSTVFQTENVQAIVVLGGGMQSASREYGPAALGDSSIQRLHYAATLSRQTGLPMAYSGGKGWGGPVVVDREPTPPVNPAAASIDGKPATKTVGSKQGAGGAASTSPAIGFASKSQAAPGTEAAAAQNWLAQLGLPMARWVDDQSKDTQGNAKSMAAVLAKDGVTRIALVTHASHMPRSVREFEAVGLKVVAAPTYFTVSEQGKGLDWFPSGSGLRNTRRVLHEIVGLEVQRRRQAE
jgi:uncharacterized SAM-binding protein YcdF (DUF218 family)